MEQGTNADLSMRLSRMERRLRIFQALFGVTMLALAAGVVLLFLRPSPRYDRSSNVLHVRGLIVEDDAGHDRILIGAPVPSASGRKRKDNTVGLIVLGENGADRVALAAPMPAPQIQGVIGTRIGAGTGLVVDDEQGDERGGMAVLDNDGRISLGLDYPHGSGEAINLGVLPGEASITLHDTNTSTRAALVERNDAAPIIFGLDRRTAATSDLTTVRLNPYQVKHVTFKATDELLNAALDNASH
jgi:hypothetical protein